VIASVVGTGNKFIADVLDTGEQLSLVTVTPCEQLSPVSTIPENIITSDNGDKFIAGDNDSEKQLSSILTPVNKYHRHRHR
jgi:hypothetical protein